MIVTLTDITKNAAETIGRAAAICYDADTSEEANRRRAVSCKDKGHLATMRFAYASFNVSGISRVCSHQLVRIAHAGILQRSQRYTESKAEFVTPPDVAKLAAESDDIQMRISKLRELSLGLCEVLRANGIKKEDARYYLLQGCTTEVNLCLNFQAWQDFLKNRTDNAASWEVREVAKEIQRILQEKVPELF